MTDEQEQSDRRNSERIALIRQLAAVPELTESERETAMASLIDKQRAT